jgi:hypothetical protein
MHIEDYSWSLRFYPPYGGDSSGKMFPCEISFSELMSWDSGVISFRSQPVLCISTRRAHATAKDAALVAFTAFRGERKEYKEAIGNEILGKDIMPFIDTSLKYLLGSQPKFPIAKHYLDEYKKLFGED